VLTSPVPTFIQIEKNKVESGLVYEHKQRMAVTAPIFMKLVIIIYLTWSSDTFDPYDTHKDAKVFREDFTRRIPPTSMKKYGKYENILNYVFRYSMALTGPIFRNSRSLDNFS
jgi:hypothetical protein